MTELQKQLLDEAKKNVSNMEKMFGVENEQDQEAKAKEDEAEMEKKVIDIINQMDF